MSIETVKNTKTTESATTLDDLERPDLSLPPLPADWKSLASAFVHSARSRSNKIALVDSTKASLTYGDALLRSAALGRAIARSVQDDAYVGIFLPPTVPTAVANIAVTLLGKIPVNLNYTSSKKIVDSSIEQCGIKHVLTSQKILDRAKFEPAAKVVRLEELAKTVTTADKIFAAAVAKIVPIPLLGAFLPGLRTLNLDSIATVVFTSGSTGDPKGVVLSQRNVLSNIHQINNHIELLPDEVVLGVLPFFHSFGFTVTLWTVLCLGKKGVYHFNPLDTKIVTELCREHGANLLVGTPTFVRNYVHRGDPAAFRTIVHLVLGAEKLRSDTANEIRETWKIEPLEGYGCTELSPVVSVNTPHDRPTRDGRTISGNRPGSVGMPLPGTAIKTVDPDTGVDLKRGETGLILVKGPQVMTGYLNKPEATAKVIRDGWYSTGDLGRQDADGFLWITDRLSRFSKIGGEMVSHLKVESAIMEATGRDEQAVAVTSLPDPKRGERLIVVHVDLGQTPAEVCRKLGSSDLPKLWIPDPADFVRVKALPILGTGKLDLRTLREIARERFEPKEDRDETC